MLRKILLPILFMSLTGLVSSCSKKEKKVDYKAIGGFKYIEASSTDPSLLAELEDIKITRKEIEDRSKVIQELNKLEKNLESILVYRAASKKVDERIEEKKELEESYPLTIFLPEPEEGFENLASRVKVRLNEKIKVEFVEGAEEKKASNVLGTFMGEDLRLDNIEKNHIRYIEIITQKHDELLKLVEGTLTRKLLFADAKKQGVSIQELLENKVITQEVNPSDEEVVAFMKAKNISEQEINDDLKKSFKNILIEQIKNKMISKYVSEQLAKTPIQFYDPSPKIEFSIKADWSPLYGPKSASHTIYFFTNPNCSVCTSVKDNILKAMASNNYDVNMHTFYLYPDWDREAKMFAEASMCVFLQDGDKFWDYHNRLVDFEGKVVESNLYEFAEQVSVNTEEFKTCFLNRKPKDIVEYHLKYSDYLGVNSQPTLIVKGKIYPGVVSTERLIQVFNNDLRVEKKPGFFARIINYIKNIFS